MGRKSEESRVSYNKIASEYDTSREGQYTRFHIEELMNTVDVKEGDAVLDVACGNGTLLGKLKSKVDIQAHGIDISENMIRVAKKRYSDIDFKVESCCPLQFNDDSIDVITVCCAFHHFENPQGFANECKRVLRKDGVIYIADPNFNSLIRFIANSIIFPFTKSGDVKVYSAKELKEFFYKAGFQKVRTYRKGSGTFLKAK